MRRLLLLALLLVVHQIPSHAQSTTGAIAGAVTDGSRAAVPGATITVLNEETGQVRVVNSDTRGGYRALDLAPGTYTVTAEQQGFAPAVRTAVRVTMGTSVTANLTLEISGVTERVSVEGPAPLDSRGVAAGGVVTRRQIEELPLNGRSYLQLAALMPGVVISRASGREFSGGYGAIQLSMAGARPEQTTFLLDGTSIADISDKAPSGLAGATLGVEAIREFSVQTHGYSAEFGRAAGGIVSAVTKSGTNRWRGSLFEFHRNSALDARGHFDPPDAPTFLRNQFGGSLGGPLARDRLFVFGSYEALRARNVVTRSGRLPDAAAHQGRLPGPDGTQRPVAIHPTVQPYLDLLFPVPDGQSFGDGTAELRHAHRDPVDEDFGVVKLDWHAGRNDTFMARVSRDVSSATRSLDHPLFENRTGAETRYVTLQHQHVFGADAVNTLRLARNQTLRDDDVLPLVEIPRSLYFTSDPHFGAINVIGLALAGATGTIPARYDQRLYQLANTFTLNRGRHLWKAGVDWQRYRFGGTSYSRYGGEFRFRNLEEFLTLGRSSNAQADRFTGNLPGTDTRRDMRQDYAAFFVQDDWRLHDALTLSLGLRYEFVTTPTEKHGQIAGLLSLEDLESGPRGVTPGTPLFDNPSGRSLAPRLGFNWVPDGGQTSVRGGYGVFYQPLTVSFYRGTIFRIFPYFAGVDLRQPPVFGPGIQDVLAGSTDVRRRSEFIFHDARQPFMQQWHFTAERDLGAGFSAEIGYLGSRGHNLPFYGDPNAVPAERLPDGRKRVVPGASLRYPSWGRIRTRINVARSESHALVAGVRRRFTDGLALQGSYTLGHTEDTWSGGQHGNDDYQNGVGSATDWWDPEAELGPANFDVRHTLTVNAVYTLPWGENRSGLAGMLVTGWSVSGLVQLASGLPFTPFIGFDRAGDEQSDADTVQKPDQIGPVSYPRTTDAWFDATAFGLPEEGFYGNTRRNSLRGPGLKLVDLAVFRQERLGGVLAQFRLEAFNVFNFVNLGLPDAAVLFNEDGSYRAGAGRISSTATPGRQLQLGLKLLF